MESDTESNLPERRTYSIAPPAIPKKRPRCSWALVKVHRVIHLHRENPVLAHHARDIKCSQNSRGVGNSEKVVSLVNLHPKVHTVNLQCDV